MRAIAVERRRHPVRQPRRAQAGAALSTPSATRVAGRVVLDVGASTGGFTDCVLQRGARAVIAVDVGYGQFAWSLRQDPRVTLLERTNVRRPRRGGSCRPRRPGGDRRLVHLPAPGPAPVVDVPGGRAAMIVALVKPQFEVGKGQVGSGGVVRDPALHAAAVAACAMCGSASASHALGDCESPLHGAEGQPRVLPRPAQAAAPRMSRLVGVRRGRSAGVSRAAPAPGSPAQRRTEAV